MSEGQKQALIDEKKIDAFGKHGFEHLAFTQRALYEAIKIFPFDPKRDDYCGNCAEALREHLSSLGFKDFHHHAHGHSFLANDEFVVDVWPDNQPKLWRKDDQILCKSVYATFFEHPTNGQHACWCGDPAFGPHEHIGVAPKPAPSSPSL